MLKYPYIPYYISALVRLRCVTVSRNGAYGMKHNHVSSLCVVIWPQYVIYTNTYRFAGGGLLASKRPSLARQKAVFRVAKDGLLQTY